MLPSPKAAAASRRAVVQADSSSSGPRTTRMPRPPPPATAFSMTGYASRRAARNASAAVAGGRSVPGSTGSPARCMARRACVLSPSRRSTAAGGPMNAIPQASTASARPPLSARNP